jgi:2,5-diketo-D-gluconate reductase A
MTSIPEYSLNDGNMLPALGLGTYGLRGADGIASIVSAIESGYRLLDTALNYKNEQEVGEGIRASGVDRSDLIVTTKLPGRHHGFDEAIASCEESLGNLGLDWIDLYLIHWPNPRLEKYLDTWRGMIALRERGLVRSIGVSNFTEPMLTRLISSSGVTPTVNQVELHPYFPQDALRAFNDDHEIRTESWSPLANRSELLQEEVIREIALVHEVTPAQVVLRWHVELEATPIPKSADAERQRENADVFGFELTEDQVDAITALERGRLGGVPDTHEEF